ncbi:MAG: hypothetical protein KC593_20160 [Myxococcales bacterium]|nr:hypothetical protein [Myxococcales bacterium]
MTLPSLSRVLRSAACVGVLLVASAGAVHAQLPGSDLPPPPGMEAPASPPAGPERGTVTQPPPPTPSQTPTPASAPPPTDGVIAPAPADTSANSGARTALVVDAATRGIDPRVGQHVTHAMRQTLAAMGYAVASSTETVAAAQRARMTYPPAPADLWRVTLAAGVDRGAFARVWADAGRYVFELSVASADGTGPFFARGSSGAEDLYAVVERLTREAVPAPNVWDAAAAARYRAPVASAGPADSPLAGQLATPSPSPTGARTPFVRPVTPREARAADAPGRRLQLALYTVSAIGADGNGFYNHLLELSLGVRLRRDMILSLQLGYANLDGRHGREHNLMPSLVVEKRLRLAPHLDLSVPIKGSVGFLPFNGPVLRVSAGLAYAFGERVELTADLICPSFWLIDDRVYVSMNVSLGLIVRL